MRRFTTAALLFLAVMSVGEMAQAQAGPMPASPASGKEPADDGGSEKYINYGLTGGIGLAVLPSTGVGKLDQSSFTAMPYGAWFPGMTFYKGATREYCLAKRSDAAVKNERYAQNRADRYAAEEIKRRAKIRKETSPEAEWKEAVASIKKVARPKDWPPEADEWTKALELADEPDRWTDEFTFAIQNEALASIYWKKGEEGTCWPRQFGIFAAIPLTYRANVRLSDDSVGREVTSIAAVGLAWSPHPYFTAMVGYSLGKVPESLSDSTAKNVWIGAPIIAVGSNIDILRGIVKP